MLRNKIPVSVIVVTKNEEDCLARCLSALSDFSEIIVVDSGSDDATCDIAASHGAQVFDYVWDGQYPKKRQWCLNALDLRHDWVFFVDADEVVTPDAAAEIAAVFDRGEPFESGFFVRARYVWRGVMLRYGLCNNKLCLFDKKRVEFPVIDDLGLSGMGEIEGHYQPVLKADNAAEGFGQIRASILHYAVDDEGDWEARHERYAMWEVGMNARHAWPRDPVKLREFMKRVFRAMPCRSLVAFVHCYIVKFGFLDGAAGYDFARSRMRYYRMISAVSKPSIN